MKELYIKYNYFNYFTNFLFFFYIYIYTLYLLLFIITMAIEFEILLINNILITIILINKIDFKKFNQYNYYQIKDVRI